MKALFHSALIAVAATLLAGSGPALAQADYPSKPVRVIVPFAAGGGIDITARMASEKISEVLGQQIVVQNQGGASGSIATSFVVKSDPDGYTLLYHSTTGTVHSAITDKLAYDWLGDLVPVAIITRFAPVMVVSPTLSSGGKRPGSKWCTYPTEAPCPACRTCSPAASP